jgi:hypothetical protein
MAESDPVGAQPLGAKLIVTPWLEARKRLAAGGCRGGAWRRRARRSRPAAARYRRSARARAPGRHRRTDVQDLRWPICLGWNPHDQSTSGGQR